MPTTPTPNPVRDEEEVARAKPPFLRRVRIRNYKSIAFCDVTLEPLTILVGKNGAGKSNFLDAIAFVADVIRAGTSEAIDRHGGLSSIKPRSFVASTISIEIEAEALATPSTKDPDFPRHPLQSFHVRYELSIPTGGTSRGKPRESIDVTNPESGWIIGYDRLYDELTIRGETVGNGSPPPRLAPAGLPFVYFLEPPLLQIADAFRSMKRYNFIPQSIRELPRPSSDPSLRSDGSNLASAIEAIRAHDSWVYERIGQYLSAVVPEIESYDTVHYGDYESVRFRVKNDDPTRVIEFDASSMSDGTLRVLAALVAVCQIIPASGSPSLVAIEEPETALHPAAMRALVGALDEATLHTQILLTTHSPDLLDAEPILPRNVRVVEMIEGASWIGPLDKVNFQVVEKGLNTLGGLERDGLLKIDLDDLDRQRQLRLESGGASP
jgi:predicted ATPase